MVARQSFVPRHGISIEDVQRTKRVMRRPQHTFQVAHKPWTITPFLLAAVLPGETLEKLLIQSRVVTDPIKNPLIGWWCEYYFFYVKHRDMPGRDDFTAMMLDPDKDMSAYEETGSHKRWSYNATGGMKWVEQCLEAVVEEFFRNEGELWDDEKFGDVPIAQLGQDNWLDSVETDPSWITEDVDLDAVGPGAGLMASEVEQGMQTWRLMRHGGLTNQTYEEWLSTYGTRPTSVEIHKPELIRYLREWTYPSNTVVPTTGAVSSACSWAIAERADKKRYFKEPGFVFGVTIVRPKVYLNKQYGAVAAFMNDAYLWLPAILTNDWRTSMRKFSMSAGPLASQSADYWVDLRDLLLYGDQWTNQDLTSGDLNMVALPTATLQKRYAAEVADSDALFSTADLQVRQDGVVSLQIATHQMDQSITN